MQTQPDHKFQQILGDIRSHFSFLFERGYQLTSILFMDAQSENWNAILAGNNCLIRISYQDKNLRPALCSMQLFDQTGLFDLYDLLHLMSKESVPFFGTETTLLDETEQIRTAALLLEKHLDEILVVFHRIHMGIAFNKARALFQNNPRFLFREVNETTLFDS